ncbi:MAG: hypothetical protein B7C24_13450 [Bacteroidetes bacterium 4572_77]|nr:MAG: hypothetical protein B7C24_13450 [Bacteroidetes bacterium 4572_77]
MLSSKKTNKEQYFKNTKKMFELDIIIMIYVLALALLIYQAEKLTQKSLTITILGLLLTPLAGFTALGYFLLKKKK